MSEVLPGMAGKQWVKQSLADYARDYGAIGEIIQAVIQRTNPVRSAALLAQSPDLRVVGEEQVNGVAATRYSGTIRFTDLVEDLRLGLDRRVLDDLRAEYDNVGPTEVQQYDLWVDEQGRPIRAAGRMSDAVGTESYTIDYTDYAAPRPIKAPPTNEVVEKDQMFPGLGPGPN